MHNAMTLSLPLQPPLRFEPHFRATAWGGRRLARFLGKNLPQGVLCGESWEVSDHPGHASVVATGNLFGHTLRQLMQRHRAELLGPAAAQYHRFPWLIKLLDVRDRLSVQVHPDERAVVKLWPGENAKTEAWLVLDADRGSFIDAGLRPGVGPDELRATLARGSVIQCLHRFAPRPGDFLFLPAGTVHAAGGGVLLAEIQQTSDATFRLYDWDRKDSAGQPRPLHVAQALASIDWKQGPRMPVRAWPDDDGDSHTPLLRCPYFAVDSVRRRTAFALGGTGRLQALIVATGQGRLDNGEFVLAGDAWVLPATMPAMTLRPEGVLTALLCSLP
jgi:mannose-6-phosphate isomerase